jgi:ribosome-associated heat shock protein Hsp15
MDSSVRVDKWLWAVRLYKTRSAAAEACRTGKVGIGGQKVKPSRSVRVNEIISAQTGIITRTVKVLGLVDRRVGAGPAKEFAEDLTPESEYAKLKEAARQPVFVYPKGFGRPTKKNRRSIDRLLS